MSLRLDETQVAYLRSQPVRGFNKILLALRIAGATQAQLAKSLDNMAAETLSRIINGRRPGLKLATAQRIAQVFGVAVDDLFPIGAPLGERRAKKDRRAAAAGKVRKTADKRSSTDRREKATAAAGVAA